MAQPVPQRKEIARHQIVACDRIKSGAGRVDVDLHEGRVGKSGTRDGKSVRRSVGADIGDVSHPAVTDMGEKVTGSAAKIAEYNWRFHTPIDHVEHGVEAGPPVNFARPRRTTERYALLDQVAAVLLQKHFVAPEGHRMTSS